MVKQLEVQTFLAWTKIKAAEGAKALTSPTKDDTVLSSRTGRDFQVQLPPAKNLVELTATQVSLHCAIEYSNFVMFAMEGQRALRFEPEYWRYEEITDHKNVIFVELRQ